MRNENIFQIGHQFHKSSLDTLGPQQHNGGIFCRRIEIFGIRKSAQLHFDEWLVLL